MKRPARISRILVCFVLIAMLCAQSMSALAVSGSTSMATSGKKYVVTAKSLNFRSGPDTRYVPITTLRRGAVVTYLSEKNGWWRVRTSSGRIGYVDRQYLTQESTKKAGTYFATTNLRVRKSPNTSSRTLTIVNRGTRLSISQMNGDWGYVSSGAGAKGWVALSYLSVSGVGSGSAGSANSTGTYVVAASRLNVRRSASRHADRVTALSRGAEVRVTRIDGNWGRVTYYEGGRMKDGWVSMDYLRAK